MFGIGRINKLASYRDLHKQADLVAATPINKRTELLQSFEKDDEIAGNREAQSKNSSNILIMLATFSFGLAAALLGTPLWALIVGLVFFATSLGFQALGVIIETNRNQSQSDSIARDLFNKKQNGLDIGEIPQSTVGKRNNRDILKFIDQASKAPPEEGKKILEKAIKNDRKNTRREQLAKITYFGLYLAGICMITVAGPYFLLPVGTILGAAATFFGLSFVADGIGAKLEANRNKNQNTGLRRSRLADLMHANKIAKQEITHAANDRAITFPKKLPPPIAMRPISSSGATLSR